MLRCDLQPTCEPNRYQCARCGAVVRSRSTAENTHRTCAFINLAVTGRGRGCGCSGRKSALNRWLPGAGDAVEKLLDVLTAGQAKHFASRFALWRKPLRLLLRWPHGFGDAVQGTIIVRHLRHYFPQWRIDVSAKHGQTTLFDGLADRTYLLGDEPGDYDIAHTLAWYDPEQTYPDSPATKAERCLREVFGVQPIAALCRYQITPSRAVKKRVARFLPSSRFALLHYQGNSAVKNKNLDETTARAAIDVLQSRGVTPIVLDWDNRSGLLDVPGVLNYPAGHAIWGGGHGTGDGATLAAMAARSVLNLGIDSGPGHVFGAVDTPAIIAWMFHHPVNYYCLAPNVLHLVRRDHAGHIYGDAATGLAYFHEHYRHHVATQNYRRELPALIEKALDANG